jgi:transposase InsO family protein
MEEACRDGLVRRARRRHDCGPAWQLRRRERERRLRLQALACRRWALWHAGWDRERFCRASGIDDRTLRAWQNLVARPAKPQGAPAGTTTPEQRRAVLDFLLLWDGIPYRELQRHFPETPGGDLARIFWAWRNRGHDDLWRCLHWRTPGAVWAMDYSKADRPIDGRLNYILKVRDLASGCVLASLPVRHARAHNARDLLALLFRQHGPPLVLKTDNGSHFTDHRVARLLTRSGVVHLLSPPYYPRDNGACEAGIGALKTRTFLNAAKAGHPTFWTSDDLERARCQGNHRWQPTAHATCQLVWDLRPPITHAERRAFRDQLARVQIRMTEDDRERDLAKRKTPATIRRHAIAAALTHCGHLTIRSAPIPQLVSPPETA